MEQFTEANSNACISPSGHDFSRAGRRVGWRSFLAASAAEGGRFASGAKALFDFAGLAAWLKPCPDDAQHRASGFSLVESIVATAVLSIGVLSLARLIPFATRTDYGARTDSTATFVAMRQMEQILAQPWNLTTTCTGIAAPCFLDAADDADVSEPVRLACTCATIPCGPPSATAAGEAGAPYITGTETINYLAAPVAGYRRIHRINETSVGGSVKVNQGQYDVRWHITCSLYGNGGVWNSGGLYKITVAARPVGNVPGMIAVPAHVRAVKMK